MREAMSEPQAQSRLFTDSETENIGIFVCVFDGQILRGSHVQEAFLNAR